MSDMLKIAQTVVVRYRDEYKMLKERETKDIEDAIKNHTSLVEHYWTPRWMAEQRLRAAEVLEQAIKDSLHD